MTKKDGKIPFIYMCTPKLFTPLHYQEGEKQQTEKEIMKTLGEPSKKLGTFYGLAINKTRSKEFLLHVIAESEKSINRLQSLFYAAKEEGAREERERIKRNEAELIRKGIVPDNRV